MGSRRDFRSFDGIVRSARSNVATRMEWSVTNVPSPTFAICDCLRRIREKSLDRTHALYIDLVEPFT